MSPSGAHLVGVTNLCPRGPAWRMAWPSWCSSSWRVVRCSAGSGSALRGGAPRCHGQQPRAGPPLSPLAWLCAAAIAIVSVDTTAHAACFGARQLRIALCSANACCWWLSLCVPTEGGHVSWDTTNSAACCGVCREKLRCGPPNPVKRRITKAETSINENE